ncbi:TetR/AcrR family transcriptional regulator [Kitasatospora sp. NPDC096128]|uniref:TetR/AcrR family transcriptional regulator n=1 Tax=Kitasatospora sp. NPDC096128 TaxID=3155547 RepID=UPI0033172DB7
MRADARRNRAKVLEAAQAAFTEEGKLVPLDEIARRAGVGAGTVYRHFATKEALYEAVFLRRVENLTAEARKLAAAEEPPEAFYGFLAHMVEEGRTKRDLVDAMAGAGIDIAEPGTPASIELRAAIGALLTRAQAAGAVRGDIHTVDIMALVAGTIIATQRQQSDPDLPRRIFAVLCDGLRAKVA